MLGPISVSWLPDPDLAPGGALFCRSLVGLSTFQNPLNICCYRTSRVLIARIGKNRAESFYSILPAVEALRIFLHGNSSPPHQEHCSCWQTEKLINGCFRTHSIILGFNI